MSTQLEAITGDLPMIGYHPRAARGFAYPFTPKVRRYFDRKPGWVAQEIRDMQRWQTDWQFMAAHGYNPKRWDT